MKCLEIVHPHLYVNKMTDSIRTVCVNDRHASEYISVLHSYIDAATATSQMNYVLSEEKNMNYKKFAAFNPSLRLFFFFHFWKNKQ